MTTNGLLTTRELMGATGCSRQQIYALVQARIIPRPVVIQVPDGPGRTGAYPVVTVKLIEAAREMCAAVTARADYERAVRSRWMSASEVRRLEGMEPNRG